MQSIHQKSAGLEMRDNDVESCSYSLEKNSIKSKRSRKKSIDAKSDSRQSKSSFTKSLENVKSKNKASASASSTSRPRRNRVKWTEAEYDKFVKIVRRHGKDFKKLQIELKSKTKEQIKRFTKCLCAQIRSMPGHPEEDIIEMLEERMSADKIKEKK